MDGRKKKKGYVMKMFHLETDILVSDALSPEQLNTNVEEDILVSDAQLPEHLNTNVMALPQVGSVSLPADGLTWQDGLTGQDQAASEFFLDCNVATLNNSLTFSDRPPMSPGDKYFNDFFSQLDFYSQLPPQRTLTDRNSILDFNCSSCLLENECPSLMNLFTRSHLRVTEDVQVSECSSLESLESLTCLLENECPSLVNLFSRSHSTVIELRLRRGPLGNWGLKSLTCLLENECPSLVNPLSRSHSTVIILSVRKQGPLENLKLKRLALCTTLKGCSLDVRHDEIINPSADGKLDLRHQCMQIREPPGSQSGPEALLEGEMIQVDSLQHEEIVECDATNNGGNVGGEGPSLTAITLSKKNKRKMSEQKCTTNKSIGLVDLQQCYGMKREDAANSLGVSISTFKRHCREYGISRWPSHKINKDKQSLSTSTRKGVTKSVLGAEGSHDPNSVSPKLLPGAVGTVSWSSSLNGSHRGYIQGSKEGRTWILTSHDVCLGNSIKETPPAMDLFISPTHKECIEVGSFPELASEPTDSEPQRPLGGISKNLSNFFSSAAEADLEGRISESDCTDLPCSDPGSKQAMATLSCPMPHVGAKQDTKKVTIKAEYGEDKIRFQMSSTSGIDELKEEVTKRLMLKANTFSIKYEDDDGDWILIACDADLQESMIMSSSSANNKIRLLVHDKIDNSRKSTKSCRGLKRKRFLRNQKLYNYYQSHPTLYTNHNESSTLNATCDYISLLIYLVKVITGICSFTTWEKLNGRIRAELAANDSETCSYSSANVANECGFPSEADELKLCYCDGDSLGTIKATLCCEDMPELISDMIMGLTSVEGKVVRAEMSTVGGRTKSVLWVQVSAASGGDEGLATLQKALKVVMDKAILSPGSGQASLTTDFWGLMFGFFDPLQCGDR
ncbi:hypothetical protein F0562_003162 [Nyssa sinensis]|uniref:PB1 domain-containing protein n=1 Tax=Nyssa sinensis TaxID=561372 RepID=A0A5J5BUD4_9ASTE|nr:hypothetical protein F0562_003162 [Nyssa sinensis]